LAGDDRHLAEFARVAGMHAVSALIAVRYEAAWPYCLGASVVLSIPWARQYVGRFLGFTKGDRT
jgi:hypothetical protein